MGEGRNSNIIKRSTVPQYFQKIKYLKTFQRNETWIISVSVKICNLIEFQFYSPYYIRKHKEFLI